MTKKYAVTPASDGLIIMPRSILEKASRADRNELRLLLWLYAGNIFDASEAAAALGMTETEADSAATYWKGAGVLTEQEQKKTSAAPNDRRPVYDADVISNAIEKNADFGSLCEQFSQLTGKMLNRTDYNTLFYLFDYCSLSCAYIITVVHYCISIGKKDMRYIQGTLLSMYDSGVDTMEKLDRHLSERQRVNSETRRLRTLCGMGDRALTAKEKEYFERWFAEWNMPFETVKLAYERSVDATAKVSFAYMNKVLETWHQKGLYTAEQVIEGDKKPEPVTAGASFDSDEFFMAALSKTRRDIDDNG